MLPEDLPFRVIRVNSEDEVIARANNLIVGRAAYETPSGSIRGIRSTIVMEPGSLRGANRSTKRPHHIDGAKSRKTSNGLLGQAHIIRPRGAARINLG